MKILSKSSNRAIVSLNNKFYLVSDNGFETLVFPCDKDGCNVTFVEVAGGRGYTLSEVLRNFTSLVR